MLRSKFTPAGGRRIALAGWLILFLPHSLCAQALSFVRDAAEARLAPTPANPVTRPQALAFADEGPVPANPLARVELAADAVEQTPSIVPPHFGKPEALQPDAASYAHSFDPAPYASSGMENWSPTLVHPWFVVPWFPHSDPNDPERHIGIGEPLIGTSWRNRPLYVGTFAGGLITDDLLPGRVSQNDTSFVGLRLGADFDHYWGVEGRYAFARPELTNELGQRLGVGQGRDYFGDVEILHYPFGDARWRPYILAGIGFQTFRFHDETGARISESLLSIPVGAGLKYFYGPCFTLRFDFVDNIAIGNNHLPSMHNFGLMAGAEFRFGGKRLSYYPWHNDSKLK